MKYRRLGRTEFMVSEIGFGGIPLQKVDPETARQLLARAQELGMNFLDTARGYGTSEERFGYALQGRREHWIVASKSPARTREGLLADIEKSRAALGVDVIDLYQLHMVHRWPEYEQVMAPDGALEGLKEARDAGRVKKIGITSHKVEILVEAVKTGEFDTVQIPYNYIEREPEKELLALAKAYDVGVIGMKPLAGGAITHPAASLRFILQSDVVPIPGMGSLAEVEENAFAGDKLFSEEDRLDLEKDAETLGNTFCRRCEYCMPCPQGITIPYIFLFDRYLTRYNLPEWAKERYAATPVKVDACIQCGACEKKCPYDLPIRKMLQEAKARLEA